MNKKDYQITLQEPLTSIFGKETTAIEVLKGIDLTDKIAIVTGGYSGLGLETVRSLSQAGAKVIVPARSLEKAKESLHGIPNVELESLDLLDPVSIDSFSKRFLKSGRPLNILINSAGIMAVPLIHDSRGYESQFATNHLGHFQLTARLWPALVQANGARVITVSSGALFYSGVNFEDPNYQTRVYDKWQAYGQSKSANSLFSVELDKRGRSADIRAFSVHPGAIITDLSRHLSDDEMRSMGAIDDQGNRSSVNNADNKFKSVEQGVATAVWAATSPQLIGKGGVYCENVNIAQAVSETAIMGNGVPPWAIDKNLAKKLWTLSEELTGITF